MPISLTCDDCGKTLRLKDELAGKTIKCSECGARLRVPEDDEPNRAERRRRRDESSARAPMVLIVGAAGAGVALMIAIIVVVKLVQWASQPAVAANAPAPAPQVATAPVAAPPAGDPADVIVHSKKTVTLPSGEVVTVSDETKRLTGDEAAARRQEFKNEFKARTRLPPAVVWAGAPDPQKPGPQLRGNEPIREHIPHTGIGKSFGSFPYSPSVFVFGGGVTPIGGELQVLSLQTGRPAGHIHDASFDEGGLALSSDGKYFAGASRLEKTVSLISTGTSPRPQTVKLDESVEFLAFGGSSRLVAQTWNGGIVAWPIPDGQPEVRIPLEENATEMSGLSLSHGGRYAARPIRVGLALRVCVFDLENGTKVGDFDPPGGAYVTTQVPTGFSIDGTRFGALFDETLMIWDLTTGTMVQSLEISGLGRKAWVGRNRSVGDLQWFPENKFVLLRNQAVISLETQSVVHTVSDRPRHDVAAKVLPNGQLAVMETKFGFQGSEVSTVNIPP